MKEKVLIVDDQEINRDMLSAILERKYEPIEACNGREAVEILEQGNHGIVMVLLDLVMPEMDGYEFLQYMNEKKLIDIIPVVVISGESTKAAERRCLQMNVADFIRKPFDNLTVLRRVTNIVNLYLYQHELEAQVDAKTDEIRAQNKILEEQAAKLRETNEHIIELLGTVVEYRNLESGQHIKRVKGFTRIMAEHMARQYPEYGLDEKQINIIVAASALHDVGKIAISDTILLKPGRLTKEEFERMKLHTTEGSDIIERMKGLFDANHEQVSYDIARYHHERFDGRGYPDGLVGDEIPIAAQLVSVADVYDALVTERCYKKAFSKEQAYEMILNGECGIFSEKLMECFKAARAEFEALADYYSEPRS